uniref:Uncharacterized protein n=1 Tax=Arundo donax TaxID=35708 RepID=A0A0A9EEE6_ARUDO
MKRECNSYTHSNSLLLHIYGCHFRPMLNIESTRI